MRLAREQFMASRRIEMGQLAHELGVSRMTLNRWVGSRDLLLGEVSWSLGRATLDGCRRRATGAGADAVASTMEAFIAAVLDAPFMRHFLKQESEIALRILTTRASSHQRSFIEYVTTMLREDAPANGNMPVEDLAYLIVRIAESFCYVDLITGDQPDSSKVGKAIAALLR
ncbi:TetR/AcrR family transcriptional regulator [Aeromicrobium endophyticum]|uniref:TetR/AcrR family transcriptional regulator n=1 Tax=Aeromicrobium endophyticum TaxID=2292704 RepID=A0A371PDN8_9ACTN|nr:TetR/AcrR family transcriptional regulator [Aeromicrobium endophyticum]